MNERLEGLMSYLNTLAKLNENTYRCNTEIGEAINEIRTELEVRRWVVPPSEKVTVLTRTDSYEDIMFDLSGIPSLQLKDELAKRDGDGK